MRAIPIGISSFKQIITQDVLYVDKTAFIKEIINSFFGTKLYLRPRRFGKTTNMQMLKEYFDITKKEENKDLFKGLYIDSVEKYKEYQNAYPVIALSLKEVKADNWNDMYDNFKNIIINVYEEHKCVMGILEDYQKEKYYNILKGKANKSEYQNSLKKMTEYLQRYYGKKVILLIDEYDVPLNASYTKDFLEKSRTFISSFLSVALKDNECLQVGILTGVLQIGQQSIFSELNNLKIYNVFSDQASEYFGFTKAEVKQMLEEYSLSDKYEEVEQWYDGYNIGNIEIFNPWSILQYLDNGGKAKAYWVNTGNTNLLNVTKENVNAQAIEAVNRLLNNETVVVRQQEKTIYDNLMSNYELFINLLVFSGYLTIAKQYKKDNADYASVKIPNSEVSIILKDMQSTWLSSNYQYGIIDKICKSIIDQDDKLLEDTMNTLLLEDISYYISSEEYYKGMFAIALTALPKGYIYKSEVTTGYGRDDYEIYKEDKSVGMIFEFKVCNKERKLEQTLEEGMKQIYAREYYTQMEKEGIRQIYLYSIAFCKKKMLIKKELYVPKKR